MRKLKHQMQPTSTSCVSTCLAMILGEPAENVIDEFHGRYVNDFDVPEGKLLEERGYDVKYHLTCERYFESGRVYCLGVPSLNIVGGMHAVVFDYRDPDNMILLDPNEGYPDRKYYVWPKAEGDLQVTLNGFDIDFSVSVD